LHLRGYTTVVIEAVTKQLRARKLLDDETFAQNWVLFRLDRGYGPKRIEQELEVRGIDPLIIRQAIGKTFDLEVEEKKAKIVLEKRFKEQLLSDPKILRRAIAFLQRRGFTGHVVNRLLRNGVQED